MAKKSHTRRVIDVTHEDVETKNPVAVAIKRFFDVGELDPVLNDISLTIRVRQFDKKSGAWATLHGQQYTNLEGMMQALGERYGNQRYKFYIMAKDTEGKPVGSVIVDDYPFVWDQDEAPPQVEEPIEEEPLEPDMSPMMTMLMNQITNQNNLMMKMIETMGNMKGGGGGMKSGDVLEAIQFGATLAGAKVTGTEEGDGGINLNELVKSPLGQALALKIMGAGGAPAPKPADPNKPPDKPSNGHLNPPVHTHM